MAGKTHIALFVERFVKFNLNRYAGDPEMLPLFQGLTESDLQISDIATQPNGRRSATIVSASRNFRGDPLQTWTPAPAATTLGLYLLRNSTPLADINVLEVQTMPGLYSYLDAGVTKVGVVIASSVAVGAEKAAIESVVRANLAYDIPTITTVGDDTFTQLIGDTFFGNLEWVKGTVPIKVIPPTDYGLLTNPT